MICLSVEGCDHACLRIRMMVPISPLKFFDRNRKEYRSVFNTSPVLHSPSDGGVAEDMRGYSVKTSAVSSRVPACFDVAKAA